MIKDDVTVRLMMNTKLDHRPTDRATQIGKCVDRCRASAVYSRAIARTDIGMIGR